MAGRTIMDGLVEYEQRRAECALAWWCALLLGAGLVAVRTEPVPWMRRQEEGDAAYQPHD